MLSIQMFSALVLAEGCRVSDLSKLLKTSLVCEYSDLFFSKSAW